MHSFKDPNGSIEGPFFKKGCSELVEEHLYLSDAFPLALQLGGHEFDEHSDVTAWPGSCGLAQAEPYEAPAGLPGAYGSGFERCEKERHDVRRAEDG